MTHTRFFLLAAFVAWFAHDGRAQVHMSAGTATFTDSRGVAWTPNICTGWRTFPNPGSFPSPAYNTPAYTATAGVPIVCRFSVTDSLYRVLVHLIEGVKTFSAPQRRVFDIYVNGDPALTNVDIFARAGGVEFPVDVATVAATRSGVLEVSFLQVKSSALFAGIELIPIAPLFDFMPIGSALGHGVPRIVVPNPASPSDMQAIELVKQGSVNGCYVQCLQYAPEEARAGVDAIVCLKEPLTDSQRQIASVSHACSSQAPKPGVIAFEVPVGAVDGANATYQLSHAPSALYLYINGLLQFQPVVSGNLVTLPTAPQTGDAIWASYTYSPGR